VLTLLLFDIAKQLRETIRMKVCLRSIRFFLLLLLVFEEALKLQANETYKTLLQTVFKIFDNLRHNMRAHYYLISNRAVFGILSDEIKTTDPIVLLKV
jgi:hypothetical protein